MFITMSTMQYSMGAMKTWSTLVYNPANTSASGAHDTCVTGKEYITKLMQLKCFRCCSTLALHKAGFSYIIIPDCNCPHEARKL